MRKKAKSEEHNPSAAHPTVKEVNSETHARDARNGQEGLVERLREGDRGAAAELVEQYYRQIYLYMRRLGHDPQVSEDLTQESFLNAWYHIGQLKDGKALRGWLYRIAGNVSKLYWRKHKGKKAVSIELVDVPGKLVDSDEGAGAYERLEQLRAAVGRLPPRLREVIVLHYMQELTISEAAQAAGIKQGTFKSRLGRALKILRKQVP